MELAFIIGGVIGSLVGSIVFNIIRYRHTVFGVFYIDRTNPEKDIHRLYIDNLDIPTKKKYMILKIDHNAHLSQD